MSGVLAGLCVCVLSSASSVFKWFCSFVECCVGDPQEDRTIADSLSVLELDTEFMDCPALRVGGRGEGGGGCQIASYELQVVR